MNIEEVWKDIEGYEGRYLISNRGNVKSLLIDKEHGKFMSPSFVNGYKRVKLRKNGSEKNFLVHRLVAIAFIPNPEGNSQVNHIDGNKINNDVSNLEWVTNKENSDHAWSIGLHVMTDEIKGKISETRISKGLASGENNPMYGKKITEEHRKKLSDYQKGRVGKKNPISTPIVAILLDGRIIEYESIPLASEELGINYWTLYSGLKDSIDEYGIYTNQKTKIKFKKQEV